ncbi:MAG: 16S rRNA (guanine(527)-N(7))-methyltransferase RsmG [Pirellulaceae bacterium]
MASLSENIVHYQLEGITPPMQQQLEQYCRLLWSRNKHLNLTRHTDYEKFVSRDLLDSLQLSALIPAGQEVLDVGSGGGVPGIVLSILRPDLEITLAESVTKKAEALNQIIEKLGLPIPVHNSRAESLLEDLRFDLLVSRAVGPLWKICYWFQSSWHEFQCILAIKGPRWVEERTEARQRGLLANVQLRKATSYPMPGTESESVILKIWLASREEPLL